MFQIDLTVFKDSNEFIHYIDTEYVPNVDQSEAILIGSIYVLISECSTLLDFIFRLIKKLFQK